MKAMILAAGLGTRLRPLTLERAKPAIPLLGKPLVIRLMEKLMEHGVSEFRMNLHHLPHSIEQLFNYKPWDQLPVSFSFEQDILGTAGGLKANELVFDGGTFLMANSDIVADFPLADALAFHRDRGALATLILYPQQPPYRHSPLRIDKEGRLRNFRGTSLGGNLRPETYVFTGIHILEPEIFQFITPGIFCEINDEVYPKALTMGKPIHGFPVTGYWNDLGDPCRYLEAQKDLFLRMGPEPFVHISTRTQCHETAMLGPFVSAEAGCLIEREVVAQNTILWGNVRLNRGTQLHNCIVGSSMTVEGLHVNQIICREGSVPLV
jgi:NDP-sugar pyrophosphorylase family protein